MILFSSTSCKSCFQIFIPAAFYTIAKNSRHFHLKMTSPAADSPRVFQCVICLDEECRVSDEVILPCCGKARAQQKLIERGGDDNSARERDAADAESSCGWMRFCRECIKTLADGDRERCIRCPTCRATIQVTVV